MDRKNDLARIKPLDLDNNTQGEEHSSRRIVAVTTGGLVTLACGASYAMFASEDEGVKLAGGIVFLAGAVSPLVLLGGAYVQERLNNR